jgi:P27 family predicted phage terminase small subunit
MATRRKSDRLHSIQGTLRPDRGHDPKREPVAAGKLYAAPPGLTAAQRIIWRREIRNAPRGVLAKIDLEVLRQWVRIVDRCDKLQKVIDEGHGQQQPCWEKIPAHRALDRATGILLRLAAELGFSPASRPRLRIEPAPPSDDEANPWHALRLVNK